MENGLKQGTESTGAESYQCEECSKIYRHKKGLKQHMKASHQNVTYACSKCGKKFNVSSNRHRHEKICSLIPLAFYCSICSKKCATEGGLRLHQKKHEQPSLPSKQAPKRKSYPVPGPSRAKKTKTEEPKPGPSITGKKRKQPAEFRCRKCSESFENRRELYAHAMRQHFQVGQGLQTTPWGDSQAPWEDGKEVDEGLKDVYHTNMPLILQQHQPGPIHSRYNFPLDNTVSPQQLNRFALDIYDREGQAFKLNLAFGIILRNRETGQYRYFAPYDNIMVFERPLYISRRTHLRRFYLRLRRMDITTELLRQRPNTKWIPVLVTNVVFNVYGTNYSLGRGSLPDHLVRHHAIVPLTKNVNTKQPYDDDLCVFRCLALHRGYGIDSLEGPAKTYYNRWKGDKKTFSAVSLEELPDFEHRFEINVEVYSLAESGEAQNVFRSRGRFRDTMYLNLYENHLSYIKDFARYAKKYVCQTCDRHFYRSNDLRVHQRTCTGKTEFVYPGGFYQPHQTIFEKLDEFGIHVPQDQRFFEWFVCYDYEAMLQKIQEERTECLQWTQKHVPISVSICSNVDGYTEPFCIVEPNQDKLVECMVAAMKEIAEKVKELAEDRWGWVLEEIVKKINKKDFDMDLDITQVIEMEEKEDSEIEGDEKDKDKCAALERLQGQFQRYMAQLPVLGFNSSNYDLNLIKKYIAKHLNIHHEEQKGSFVVKKCNAYTCISSDQLKFLDISQFLAGGTSYAQFLKAYKVRENKGFFPYEWLDDVTKLESKELPPHEAFYSTLKGVNITEDEYKFCRTAWTDQGMKSFRDFLTWYNNLDVGPFVSAVQRLQKFYFEKGIDAFKTAISVPGIARQLLFQTAKNNNANFALCDKNNADLYNTIKNNVVGGPSIIFHRHHQAGVTRIRNGKKCGAILGFDANALYLQCIGKPMPVGPFVRRLASNDFKPEVRDKFMMATYWMDWLIKTEDKCILHKQNHGSEIRVGKYPVDGFSPANGKGGKPTCYQFHGCYWHGHDCFMTKHVKDPKWWEYREKKLKKTTDVSNYLRSKGCEVVEMWECQFRNYCQKNPEINAFIDVQRPGFFQQHKGKMVNEERILKSILDESLFGMVEVDIQVPDQWPAYFQHPTMTPYQYFEEMSPLFCTTEVPFEAMGKHMQDHVKRHCLSEKSRRLLVGGMKAKNILIATPLLKWYLIHGMVVSKIYQVVEFQPQRCFKQFVNDVSDARRRGDVDKDMAIISECMKLIGNSSYGSMIMDKTKHRDMKYVQGENETSVKVNDPRFRKLECLDPEEQYYEVEMAKKKIKLDLPIQLSYFVLQYAKLRMLEFYYDFMDVYVDRSDFEYCEMDTDSAYMAISGKSLDEIIKPEMRGRYERGMKGFCNGTEVEADAEHHWFPRTCCDTHAKYDKRTPGLFKLEYKGDEMIGLCSKTYIVRKTKIVRPTNARIAADRLLQKAKGIKDIRKLRERVTNEYKFSSKGISKRHIRAPMSIFQGVLQSQKSRSGINRGFRVRQNTIFTYTQERRGFSYFYCKRKVATDGIHTTPLDITLYPVSTKNNDYIAESLELDKQ